MELAYPFQRVATLYRVSTIAQVDRNTGDISMQKNACKAYISQQPGWQLVREYYEKGVSGYQKKADNRDVLQNIKKDAEQGLFDILLVFMADRLGRRVDETPFLIQWFGDRGIAVYSVKEGRQSTGGRDDLLLNFIRTWQSGGESEKTGIRVRERLSQMAKEGKFTGGYAPLGYDLVDTGEESKKGKQLTTLAVNTAERPVVQLIFNLYTMHGYGSPKIAAYLNEAHLWTKKGNRWGRSGIQKVLKNPIYKGYKVFGKTTNVEGKKNAVPAEQWIIAEKKNEALAIVSEKQWAQAQKIRESRIYPKRSPVAREQDELLLLGLVTCGECGAKFIQLYGNAKWLTKNGRTNSKQVLSYACQNKTKGAPCAGRYSFSQKKVEDPALNAISVYLKGIPKQPLQSRIDKKQKILLAEKERQIRLLRKKQNGINAALEKLHKEIINTLSGKGSITAEDLTDVIMDKKEELTVVNESIAAIQKERNLISERYLKCTDSAVQLISTASYLNTIPRDIQRELATGIIQSIKVSNGKIEIKLNMSYDCWQRAMKTE